MPRNARQRLLVQHPARHLLCRPLGAGKKRPARNRRGLTTALRTSVARRTGDGHRSGRGWPGQLPVSAL